MATIEERKAQLEARRAELTRRVDALEDELESPTPEEPDEQAIDIEQDEVREDLGDAAVREIRMIDAALDRIAKGTYGICTNCGNEIAEARLDAVPATPLCAECAASV
jgi:DnaK suppressor protein